MCSYWWQTPVFSYTLSAILKVPVIVDEMALFTVSDITMNAIILKKLICNYLTILSAFVLLSSCSDLSAKECFAEAEKLEGQEKYKEAITMLDKAIAKDKYYSAAYINRGADRSALGDYKGAINDYMRVVAIDSANTLALVNIGRNYKRLKEYQSAIVYFDKAMATKGNGLFIVQVEISHSNDVRPEEITYERGIAYYLSDSLKKAFADLQYSIQQQFMLDDCYQWLGYIYLRYGNKDLACKNFNLAKVYGNKEVPADIDKYCHP